MVADGWNCIERERVREDREMVHQVMTELKKVVVMEKI